MSKFKLVTTAKVEGLTKEVVSAAAEKAHPGYRVASVEDKGSKWQVRLDQVEKVSTRTRQAAPPPEFLDKKDDAGDSADEEEASESPEEEAAEDSGEKPDDDAESKGKDGDKSKGDSKSDDPVAAIEKIMGELTNLLSDLGGHATKLKEKADKVDEVHELTKGTGDVDSMEGVPPVPPLDDAAAVGPTPGVGGPPPAPHAPRVPGGKRPGGPGAGVPGVFGANQTEHVEHPMKDEDGEYGLSDVIAAITSHPELADYEINSLKAVEEDNVYVAQLKRKN